MNIFYIGPIQQQSFLGQISNAFVKEISKIKNSNIYTHSIYGGNEDISYDDISNIRQYPDINIQHCTIPDLHPDLNSKTYFIPVMSATQSIPSQFKGKLQLVDKILTTSVHDYNNLISLGIEEKKLFNLSLFAYEKTDDTISLPVFENCKKYYTLAEEEDIDTLKIVMSNFLQVYSRKQNNCLICYCEFYDPKKQSEIIEFYKKAKSHYNINNYTDKIFFMFNKYNQIEKAIHATGDVFLALNQNYFPFLHASLAQSHKNRIVGYHDLDLDIDNNGNNIVYNIINKSLQNALTEEKSKTSHIEKVDIKKILC